MTTVWLHTHLPRLASGETADVISVKILGQRVECAAWVAVTNARFAVHERGRQRCIETGVRNVHAWVVGTMSMRVTGQHRFNSPGEPFRRAVYDPWKGSAFVDSETLEPVYESPWVIQSGKTVWYVPEGEL